MAEHLGEPSGRAVAAASAAYADIPGLFFTRLLLGWFSKHLLYHMYCTFRRGFTGSPQPAPSVTRIIPPAASVPSEDRKCEADPDSGADSSNTSTCVAGRPSCRHIACGVLGIELDRYVLLLPRGDARNPLRYYMENGLSWAGAAFATRISEFRRFALAKSVGRHRSETIA